MMMLLSTAKNNHHRRSLLFLLSSAAILLTTTHAFTPPSQRLATPTTSRLNAQKRINNKIDLDSPKVATMEKIAKDDDDNEKKVYCRCWKSETFPLCDGSHMKHNKEFEDNVGPLIVTVDTTAAAAAEATDKEAAVVAPAETSTSPLKKIKGFFKKDNKKSDGLTTKERLAKMGLSALLSYGWVSNMSYAVTLSLSWYTHSKKTGMSPLAPNQWKPFLAVYAGFYVFNNIIRPLRFGMSVVVSRYFDNFVNFIQRKSGLGRKASIGVVVFLANVCGTFAAMGLGVSIASALSGVPIFPAK
jgi:CDGSH-type Zn-finger protein